MGIVAIPGTGAETACAQWFGGQAMWTRNEFAFVLVLLSRVQIGAWRAYDFGNPT